jgi:hypothetical protein
MLTGDVPPNFAQKSAEFEVLAIRLTLTPERVQQFQIRVLLTGPIDEVRRPSQIKPLDATDHETLAFLKTRRVGDCNAFALELLAVL